MARNDDGQENRVHAAQLASAEHAQGQLTETLRIVGILNSGGAVAMLAFLQAMIGKEPQFHCYKPYGLVGLAVFVFGALLVPLTFFARWQAANFSINSSVKGEMIWTMRMMKLLLASTLFFLAACAIAGFGITRL
ncbi:hypothetical protein M0D69_13920 [Caballeronia sp. SEWSISQ10-4 2]|uniref:hypothetical protein n=1 Tax=Caballeronia sp. SEWSISQ10-4 2 TaxID=2937438 RepID=UPI00264D9FDE|nr:hypothetical protein [Caballeronia sp. SEWSISQ10-4 2]MDN7179091.1 hypothetical protein [Caballeronia sp. SEWSISQ10-4 2]